MKTIIIIYEGAGDEPLPELEGRTPLQAARCHHAAALVAGGRGGTLEPWPSDTPWRSEWLLGAMCGIPAAEIGGLHRGPLEALEVGVEPGEGDMVYRGDFVTMDGAAVRDNLAGRLGAEETAELAAVVHSASGDDCDVTSMGAGSVAVRFRDANGSDARGVPTCVQAGESVGDAVAAGVVSERMRTFMRTASEVLSIQPVNDVRVDLGENPANGLWLWGGGAWPHIASARPGGGGGAMLSTSHLGKGVAALCGFAVLDWPEPWRDTSEPIRFHGPDLVRVLRENRRILVYVQAPADGGRFGSAVEKVRALDRLDQELLGPLVKIIEAYRPFRLALVAGGVVSSRTGLPLPRPAPVAVTGEGIESDHVQRWDEETCAVGGLGRMNAGDFLRRIEDR